jgi:hypothetical protein
MTNCDSKTVLRCQHFKVGGTPCGSPALKGQRYCYFHRNHRPRILRRTRMLEQSAPTISLPILEDANSIQEGIMQVTELLLAGEINPEVARAAVYALRIASSNLANIRFEANRPMDINVADAAVTESA